MFVITVALCNLLVLTLPAVSVATSYEWGSPHAVSPVEALKMKYLDLWPSSHALGFSLFGATRLEIAPHCQELLEMFANASRAAVDCLLLNARPVRICQSCQAHYSEMLSRFANITDSGNGKVPGNLSCQDSLLHSDRVQIVVYIYDSLTKLWGTSECDNCLIKDKGLSNATLRFMNLLNESLTCFEQNLKDKGGPTAQPRNKTLCENCNKSYRDLNNQYGDMKEKKILCIDVEDAMNMTRQLWSLTYNCTVPCTDTVPVVAVTAFLLFLPLIFYLSSFLHSEQMKRKLILPKRLKSSSSLSNIQENRS